MSIVREIITGGASRQITGGKIVTFPRPRNETITRIVFGDRTLMSIREKISNWRTFIDVYWKKNGTLDKKSTLSFYQVLKDIFHVPIPEDQTEVLQLIEGIFSMTNPQILNGIGKSHHLNEPIIISFRVNFMIWRDHLEELLMRYAEARNKYIKKHKFKDQKNDMTALLENWKKYDEKYEIQSSSRLLLFSNLPASPSKIPSIAHKYSGEVKWNPNIKKFHWGCGNKKVIVQLEAALKDFIYMGFCQRKPVYRYGKLLEFPIKELLLAIKFLGGESPKADYCEMLSNIKKVLISPKFGKTPPKLKLNKIPHASQLRKKYKMKSKTAHDNNNLEIRWHVDQYIELCKTTKYYFAEREKYYLDVTRTVNNIGFVVKKYVYRRHDI